MRAPALRTYATTCVTLHGVTTPSGVTLAFSERSGGVSTGPFSSLNVGDTTADSAHNVETNRKHLLAALGIESLFSRLISPKQVHGTRIVCLRDNTEQSVQDAQLEAQKGADAVVVSTPDVPVLLCFADCVPVILATTAAFAVVHSGWRGTIEHIAGRAAASLAKEAHVSTSDICAYIGPCIRPCDYEVSPELAKRFEDEFGAKALHGNNKLDLAYCVSSSLIKAGLSTSAIVDSGLSTYDNERFFSYRASHGVCGRHGALAYITSEVNHG